MACRSLSGYYTLNQEQEYICSQNDHSGMHMCGHFPPYREGDLICNGSAIPGQSNDPTNTSCVNWNQYYTDCQRKGDNPFQGTISFDNIGLAWVAIFLVSPRFLLPKFVFQGCIPNVNSIFRSYH